MSKTAQRRRPDHGADERNVPARNTTMHLGDDRDSGSLLAGIADHSIDLSGGSDLVAEEEEEAPTLASLQRRFAALTGTSTRVQSQPMNREERLIADVKHFLHPDPVLADLERRCAALRGPEADARPRSQARVEAKVHPRPRSRARIEPKRATEARSLASALTIDDDVEAYRAPRARGLGARVLSGLETGEDYAKEAGDTAGMINDVLDVDGVSSEFLGPATGVLGSLSAVKSAAKHGKAMSSTNQMTRTMARRGLEQDVLDATSGVAGTLSLVPGADIVGGVMQAGVDAYTAGQATKRGTRAGLLKLQGKRNERDASRAMGLKGDDVDKAMALRATVLGGRATDREYADYATQSSRAGMSDIYDAHDLEALRSGAVSRQMFKAGTSTASSVGNTMDAFGTVSAAGDMGATKVAGKAVKATVGGIKFLDKLRTKWSNVSDLAAAKDNVSKETDRPKRGVAWKLKQMLNPRGIGKQQDNLRDVLGGKASTKYKSRTELVRESPLGAMKASVSSRLATNGVDRDADRLRELAMGSGGTGTKAREANRTQARRLADALDLGAGAGDEDAYWAAGGDKEAADAFRELYGTREGL